MYAGSAYAAAPYAGGSTASAVEVVDGSFAGAVLVLSAWLETDEASPPGVTREVGAHRYDVARVLPMPDLVDGRPT